MQQHHNDHQLQRIDHLAFAALDLAEGVAYIENLLGVRVSPGGKHPAWGTHNVLIGLGPEVFLEIIAPDPERPDPALPPLFGIDRLTRPRLAAWAVKEDRLAARLQALQQAGVPFGPQLDGQRQRPDGTLLRWRLSDPLVRTGDGVVPFLIDWGAAPHPAAGLPRACQLLNFRLEHPNPAEFAPILDLLDLGDTPLSPGPEPALVGTIQTPRGVIELR